MSLFPVATAPTTIGGTIATSTSTTLAAIDIGGLPIGTEVWNADVGANFKLTISTAALVTDEVVAVKDTVGSRWIIVEASGGTVITDGVTLDGDGSIGNPLTAVPVFSYSWRMDVLRRIVELFPEVGFNSLPFSSDCVNIATDLTRGTPTNTGDAVIDTTTNGGSILTSTGTTNNSACVVQASGNTVTADTITASPAMLVSNSRTQAWAVYARAQIVVDADESGKRIVIACLQDQTEDNYIGKLGATSTANWAIVVGGVGVDTTVASDLLVHDFLIVNDGTNITALIDWESVGSPVAVAGVAVTAGHPRFYDLNGTTGENVSHRTFRIAMAVVEPEPA